MCFLCSLSFFTFNRHEDIVKIFHRVNVSDLVCIDYIGILDKAIKARGYIVEVRLAEAFDAMDISNRGYVTKDEILAMLVSADYTLNVDNIFESIVDDGRITYHEFLRFFDNEIEGLSDFINRAIGTAHRIDKRLSPERPVCGDVQRVRFCREG